MEAEQRLGRLERSMAYRVRLFQGVHVETPKCEIRPDSRGWLAFSSDTNLEIDRDPNIVQNHAKWKLSATIPPEGCAAAITTNIDCDASSLAATACGATVTHTTGNGYVAVQVTGTVNAQVLSYNWCAPTTTGPNMLVGDPWADVKAPVGWLELVHGNECDGGCTAVKVPYWI